MRIACTIERVTDKAYLLVIKGNKHWLPRSQVTVVETSEDGQQAVVEVADWLAKKSGLVTP